MDWAQEVKAKEEITKIAVKDHLFITWNQNYVREKEEIDEKAIIKIARGIV